MITIDEAIQKIQSVLPTPKVEDLEISLAAGRVLAENITAAEPAPLFTNSAMDGFAVRWSDVEMVTESNPVQLKISGESQAGIPMSGELETGFAARISTGARLMNGADTIIPIELINESEDSIEVLKVGRQYQHIRYQGEEFKTGDLLLNKNTVLNPPQLALLASQGISTVPVYKTPDIAIIATGSELVHYTETPQDGQIRDSNRLMLSSAVHSSGGIAAFTMQVGDNYDATVESIHRAAAECDILLFSGGVSVGPHDLVKKAAMECGFEEVFWRIKQKPGKPLFFARKGNTLFFGLPGNPVSSYMSYMMYVHPVIRHLCGNTFSQPGFEAVVAEEIRNTMDRAHLMRVSIMQEPGKKPQIKALKRQGSHMLTSISAAAGFIRVDAGVTLSAGTTTIVIPLSQHGKQL